MYLHPTLLSIAGSDPSGGAGIQADLKTMTTIGVYGAAAITCLTVQNATGVLQIIPLAPELVKKQILAVLADHRVSHIKIGMTGNGEIISCLSDLLCNYSGDVIYDPVLAASSGSPLLETDELPTQLELLLKRVSYLSPNRFELGILTQQEITSTEQAISCAQRILSSYPTMKGVLVKGGHLDESSSLIQDFLVGPDGVEGKSIRSRVDNPNLHGTGCTYSSAFASYLTLGENSTSAMELAGAYMDSLIRVGTNQSVSLSPQNGPLLHGRIWPQRLIPKGSTNRSS